MPVDEPGWWYDADGADALPARLLRPFAHLYGWAGMRRLAAVRPEVAPLPVICVGNFTAGGTGKTPFARLLAELLVAAGERPAFLTRGYGGRIKGPQWLDLATHSAAESGDEPRLLAQSAPVMIARDRVAGARAIADDARRASVIVMDDGLQNPGLAKDLAFALIDRKRGLGNGLVIPAGPLRMPMAAQLPLAQALVITGGEEDAPADVADLDLRGVDAAMMRGFRGSVLAVRTEAAGVTSWLRDGPIVAYTGIANPGRFVELLRRLGASLAETRLFRDHHAFSEGDAARLLALARMHGAQLVTTEKDWVRLHDGGEHLALLRERSRMVPIHMTMSESGRKRLASLVAQALAKRRGGDGGLSPSAGAGGS